MTEINGKIILIGDVHFGVKRFSIPFLENTVSFFTEQVFPYMEENNIKEIFQLGDLFDNRTTADINFIHVLRETFFEELKKRNIVLRSLVGNHDIFFRESRDVSLVKFFSDLYPENFILYETRTEISINGNRTYIVPWLTKTEHITKKEIENMHSILGHFEIRNFAMVKGHIDTTSEYDRDFFLNKTKVKNVFSGHYHLKNTKSQIKYLGTPLWLSWSDFGEEKGFYVWDEFDGIEFIENKISKKFVKIKYDDKDTQDGRNIEVEGLFQNPKLVNDEELKELLPYLEYHELKFFINHAEDRQFDEVLYTMKESKLSPTVINNQEITKIIGTDYATNFEDQNIEIENTRELILGTVKEHKENLLGLMMDILSEVDSKDKEV